MSKLVNCKSCGAEVSKGAKACPKCGKDNRGFASKHKILTGIGVLVLLSALGSASGNKETASTTASTGTKVVQEQKVEDTGIKKGMYKVGTDIKAGEYVLTTSGYYSVSSDSSGKLESITANDSYENRAIINLAEGQYFEFNSGKAYPIAEAPQVTVDDTGILKAGMYKVGTDIKAGEYKVSAPNGGYVEVTKDSTHSFLSIVSNDNFTGDKYVSVQDGQYIKLSRATLKVK